MSADVLRKQLYASFKNRAMMYWHLFNVLQEEVGAQKATNIMKRGIYKRGLDIGVQFKKFAPADLQGLKSAFLAFIPDDGKMFDPEVLRCDAEALEIKLRRCPLKDAWQDAGLNKDELSDMCDIAVSVDKGTFEGAGFSFSAETWTQGRQGCCRLKILPQR